jgi:Fanconi anemia group I protein
LQKAFTHLLNMTASVTTSMYNFVLWLQLRDNTEEISDEEEGKKRKRKDKDGEYAGKKQKSVLSSINRESKSIPNLIYSVEMYEKRLVELGKKVDLPIQNLVKRGVARDWKSANARR